MKVEVSPHPIEYVPPETVIGEGALIPVIVTAFDVTGIIGLTFPWGKKLN